MKILFSLVILVAMAITLTFPSAAQVANWCWYSYPNGTISEEWVCNLRKYA